MYERQEQNMFEKEKQNMYERQEQNMYEKENTRKNKTCTIRDHSIQDNKTICKKFYNQGTPYYWNLEVFLSPVYFTYSIMDMEIIQNFEKK